jgi:hypothetical protein
VQAQRAVARTNALAWTRLAGGSRALPARAAKFGGVLARI